MEIKIQIKCRLRIEYQRHVSGDKDYDKREIRIYWIWLLQNAKIKLSALKKRELKTIYNQYWAKTSPDGRFAIIAIIGR